MSDIEASNPVVVKQCRYGTMMYNRNDRYVGRALELYGEFSEAEVAFFRAAIRPGMTVVDVGANIGCHSVAFAQLVGPTGRVLAIEPQKQVYQMLVGNVALNHLTHVDTMHGALGHERGTLQVPPVDYTAAGNFGAVSLSQSAGDGTEDVPVVTLDSLKLPKCDFIKIDVEGAETSVIRGATETIRTHAPTIYAENDRPERSAELLQQILDLDYRVYWHTPEMFNPDNFASHGENVFASLVSLNVIAIPRTTPQNLEGLREIQNADEWPWTLDSV